MSARMWQVAHLGNLDRLEHELDGLAVVAELVVQRGEAEGGVMKVRL